MFGIACLYLGLWMDRDEEKRMVLWDGDSKGIYREQEDISAGEKGFLYTGRKGRTGL